MSRDSLYQTADAVALQNSEPRRLLYLLLLVPYLSCFFSPLSWMSRQLLRSNWLVSSWILQTPVKTSCSYTFSGHVSGGQCPASFLPQLLVLRKVIWLVPHAPSWFGDGTPNLTSSRPTLLKVYPSEHLIQKSRPREVSFRDIFLLIKLV